MHVCMNVCIHACMYIYKYICKYVYINAPLFGGMFVCLALSFNARRNILILRCSWETLGYSYIHP